MDEETSHWVEKTWRPAIGVTYIVINIFDFIIFPILWTITGFFNGIHQPWHPLTLEATGLFHMAFGAILGVAAWNRDPRPKFPNQSEPPIYDQYHDHRNTREYPRGNYYPKSPQIQPRKVAMKQSEIEPEREPSSVFRGESNVQ